MKETLHALFNSVYLGKNKRMGLTGRASSSEIGLLATSKLYMLADKILAFVPQVSVSVSHIYRFFFFCILLFINLIIFMYINYSNRMKQISVF